MKKRLYIILLSFVAILFIIVYIWCFQIGGYSFNWELTIQVSQPLEIVYEMKALADKHGRIANVSLEIQELWVYDKTVTARFQDFEKAYVLTVVYYRDSKKVDLHINRTRKLIKPVLCYEKWQYDVEYFQSITGDFTEYTIDGVWEKDLLSFIIDGRKYDANLITGEISF